MFTTVLRSQSIRKAKWSQ